MFKPTLIGIVMCVLGTSGFAQAAQLAPAECLHGSDETTANRERRMQAVQYVIKVNAAETALTIGPAQPRPKYRALNELPNLPLLPAGFDTQFLTDGASYSFSLKDTRDACHYAIFSDQAKLVYEAVPRAGQPTMVPLGTR